jgi:hypothetical protein
MMAMSSQKLEELREAHSGCNEHCAVKPLVAEIERQADMISDLWLFLDGVARCDISDVIESAIDLLRTLGAPGWKEANDAAKTKKG